ncbi:HD domain containing protein [Tritrichomonas foetus]|uniref:5'-deoxynucleotidase n=1 Tax=Tritrichomonas foetus TaxID=1144522 RepID=A0A1J4KTW0_9EUKA|nr:HD domain containing protein [Tritrichomonas foetus]|eukprot:OHT12917.1 HD domain containing protein [Tritrichomonas foetus]
MSTKYDRAIELCGVLKRIPRTGWVRNKVNDPESVADHSMRVSFLAMILCPPDLNKDKAVQMALIHDLAESIVSDITPLDGVTHEDKYQRENNAWTQISQSLNNDEMQKMWQEMEEGKTREARFVFELDKLEMLIQAEEYENLQPGLDLTQFFKGYKGFAGYDDFFTFKETKEVYDAIIERRKAKEK